MDNAIRGRRAATRQGSRAEGATSLLLHTQARRQPIPPRRLWEERGGFSRALRIGGWVFVSDTTATDAGATMAE